MLKFKTYSNRWGHQDTHLIKKTKNGWELESLSISGQCDKTGKPFLFKTLDHDFIKYPKQLGEYFEYLWEYSEQNKLSDKKLQIELNSLSKWCINTELSTPKSKIWENITITK